MSRYSPELEPSIQTKARQSTNPLQQDCP